MLDELTLERWNQAGGQNMQHATGSGKDECKVSLDYGMRMPPPQADEPSWRPQAKPSPS